MRKEVLIVWYVCWHAIVSLEFLVSLVAFCLYWLCSSVRDLFESVTVTNELKIVLMGIPLAVSVWIFNEIRKVWWPDVKGKAILINWPNYFRLKCCCVVACFYAIGCSAMAIVGTIFENSIYAGLGLYLVISSMMIALSDAASCWLATLSIHQMLESSNTVNIQE